MLRKKNERITIFFILVFFFINNKGLPLGLQWTTLLTPFLFITFLKSYKFTLLISILLLILYFVIHLHVGTSYDNSYIHSLILHFSVLILVFAFYKSIRENPIILSKSADLIVEINFILTIIALLAYPSNLFWAEATLVNGLNRIPRLRLFTYEPSYYALSLTPIIGYYFFQLDKVVNTKKVYLKLAKVSLSLVLSFSMGVISTMLISLFIFYSMKYKIHSKKIVRLGAYILIMVSIIYAFNPQNIVIKRSSQIISGADISGNARTSDAWIIGNQILTKYESHFGGIGWGQIDRLGKRFIMDYYNYSDNVKVGFSLPNLVTQVYVILGIFGLLLYFFMQFYLYRKYKVQKSDYRLFIFIFIFLYQFTGSYSSSVLHFSLLAIASNPSIDFLFNNKYK